MLLTSLQGFAASASSNGKTHDDGIESLSGQKIFNERVLSFFLQFKWTCCMSFASLSLANLVMCALTANIFIDTDIRGPAFDGSSLLHISYYSRNNTFLCMWQLFKAF